MGDEYPDRVDRDYKSGPPIPNHLEQTARGVGGGYFCEWYPRHRVVPELARMQDRSGVGYGYFSSKSEVVGSNPTSTRKRAVAQWLERTCRRSRIVPCVKNCW